MVATNSLPPDDGVGLLAESIIFPVLSTTPPNTLVPPISIPIVNAELLIVVLN